MVGFSAISKAGDPNHTRHNSKAMQRNLFQYGVVAFVTVAIILRRAAARDLRPSEHGLSYQIDATSPTQKGSAQQMRSFFAATTSSSVPPPIIGDDDTWQSGYGGGGSRDTRRDHMRIVLVVAAVVCGATGVVLLVVSGLVFAARRRRKQKAEAGRL